ncbi:MAG: FtsX-like permease family protein [Deltaproteobacteria bacterium]|jgi:ABC-type lipoprotein release transport system permease subunit
MFKTTLERQLNILDYALSSVWRRRLKNLSVMLVFAAAIFLLASFQMTTTALNQAASSMLAKAPEITVQRISAGRQASIPLAYGEKLKAIFGIRRIVPRIWGYHFVEPNRANYTVIGLDPAAMPSGKALGLTLAKGRFFTAGQKGKAVVGQGVVKTMNLADRRNFSLFRPDLTLKPFGISGVFAPGTNLLTDDLIVTTMADARDLFRIPAGMVTDFCVYVANPAEIQTIAGKIAKRLPDTRVLTRPQIQKTYQVVFGWRSGFGSVCLLTALAAFTIFAWDKASGLSPEERREISILKILGWETADVLTVRFWEGLLVSALAFAVGCTLAWIHVVKFGAALFRPVMMGWSVISTSLHLVPDLALADFLLIFAFTVLPYLAATIIPAWRAATVPADSAIR